MSTGAAERAAKTEEVFIALLKKFTEQHQTVSHATGRNYAPARFAEHPEAQTWAIGYAGYFWHSCWLLSETRL
jgi:hypothetical protein